MIQSHGIRRSSIALAFAAGGAWGTALAAADWPQWQGPDRNSMSRERGLLQEWTPDGPPLAWKVDGLGGGDSAPSVAGGRILRDDFSAPLPTWSFRESPLVDGDKVVVTPGAAGATLVALDKRTGGINISTPLHHDGQAFADGRLYYRTEDEQPGRSGKPAWAHPVIANGRLYLRDHDVLLVYDIRKGERSHLER